MEYSDYMRRLSNKGNHLGEVRKNQADMIMNASFTGDISYRKVYILDPVNGWHYEDARFFKHQTPQLARDAVDSWLQFRPKIHYPIGTYVFIPDDTSYEMDIDLEHPLTGNIKNLWWIVNKTDYKQFVQYQVIRTNWNFKWIIGNGDQRIIQNCIGSIRNANSYTSGIWRDYRVVGLDNLTRGWVPDTYNIYKDKLEEFELCDTRLIRHQMRMMLTYNKINPKIYMVSKVDDTTPPGVVQISFKEDEFDAKRDNVELLVCNYYNDSGDVIIVKPKTPEEYSTSVITYMSVNNDGELEQSTAPEFLSTGVMYYYSTDFSDAQWRIELQGDHSEDDRLAIERLMVIRKVNDNTISLRPGKSNKLKGLQFKLKVCDINGDHESSIDLEVAS